MKYALVIKDKIENIGYLPRKLFGIPEPQLNKNGWYKVELDTKSAKEYETIESSYKFLKVSNKVVETKVITKIPLADYKKQKYESISNAIKSFILETYPDYKQMSAALGLYDTVTSIKIKTYVGKYLGIALSIKSFINSATLHKDIETAYFRKPVYDTDGMTVLSYDYWVV